MIDGTHGRTAGELTDIGGLGHCEVMDLELRFTEARSSLAPPNIAAFSAVDHALLREQAADHDDTSPLADLVAAGVIASRMRLIDDDPARSEAPVFVQRRHGSIPAPVPEASAPEAVEAIETDSFRLADHAHGHFAWPRKQPSRAGSALVLAACIPMFVPDVAAAQAAAAPMRPTAQPTPTTTVVPPAPAPAPASASASASVPAPVVAPPPPMTSPPAQVGPTQPVLPNLQQILYAMKGHEATVYVAGRKVRGLIVGVDGDFVMMVDEERDGKIALIPKAQITEIRGKTRPERNKLALPPDGTGALAGGGVLVAFGGPLTISGLVFVAITPSYTPLWLPQLLPGLLFLGGGIPLLVMGTRKRRAYNEAVLEQRLSRRLTPTFGRTPGGGWTGGLSLRF